MSELLSVTSPPTYRYQSRSAAYAPTRSPTRARARGGLPYQPARPARLPGPTRPARGYRRGYQGPLRTP